MIEQVSLNTLKPGEKGRICGFSLAEDITRRLQDMGLVRGVNVECAYRSPFGDPTAYLVKGAVIAIRSKESKKITIYCEEKEKWD
ncbi:MAG: ferrous iron transport protein A [Clostridiales bacterium]|nr:ferrous iron transport protein A [Clostridiales bacterium]